MRWGLFEFCKQWKGNRGCNGTATNALAYFRSVPHSLLVSVRFAGFSVNDGEKGFRNLLTLFSKLNHFSTQAQIVK
jgi:hypothetical protein